MAIKAVDLVENDVKLQNSNAALPPVLKVRAVLRVATASLLRGTARMVRICGAQLPNAVVIAASGHCHVSLLLDGTQLAHPSVECSGLLLRDNGLGGPHAVAASALVDAAGDQEVFKWVITVHCMCNRPPDVSSSLRFKLHSADAWLAPT